VDIGGKAAVTVTVTNTGGAAGTYKVNLSINGVAKETKEVSLAGGESQDVSFSVTGDAAGKKTIEINGLTGSLTVKEKLPAVTQPLPANEPTTPASTAPASTTPKDKTEDSGLSPVLVYSIIGVVVVVAAACLVYFLWWRKRSY
jgi:uncharacterized protein YfaS (alpha-2-macroglobulin family)